MSLHPTMRRRLRQRLHPLIGEEEADALLDQLPDDPVTKEWLAERFALIDDRFARIDERFARIDERFARIDDRFDLVVTKDDLGAHLERLVTDEHLERRLEPFVTKDHLDRRLEPFVTREHLDARLQSTEDRILTQMADRFTQHTLLTVAGLGGAATIISVVQAIWG